MNLASRMTLLLLLILSSAAFSAGDSRYQLQVASGYHSNLFNSPSNNNALDSRFVSAHLGGQRHWQLKPNSALQAELAFGVEQQLLDHELTDLSLSSGLYYLWQPKPGFTAAWYRLGLRTGYGWHPFAHYRQLNTNLSLARNQRLTDKLSARISGQLLGAWFEQPLLNRVQAQLSSDLDWQLAARSLLYVHGLLGYGDVHSAYSGLLQRSSTRSHHLPDEDMSDQTIGVSDDYFLDTGISGITGENWYQYRYRSGFGQVAVGWVQQLAQGIGLELNYRFSLQSNAEVSYQSHQAAISLVWQPVR